MSHSLLFDWSPQVPEKIKFHILGGGNLILYGPISWTKAEAMSLLNFLQKIGPSMEVRALRFERTDSGVAVIDEHQGKTYQLDDDAVALAISELRLCLAPWVT